MLFCPLVSLVSVGHSHSSASSPVRTRVHLSHPQLLRKESKIDLRVPQLASISTSPLHPDPGTIHAFIASPFDAPAIPPGYDQPSISIPIFRSKSISF